MQQTLRILALWALACALVAVAHPAQAQTFTTLYNFLGFSKGDGAVGQGMVQGLNGNLYGTTLSGGNGADGGTFFTINTAGKNYASLFTVGTGSTDPYGAGVAAAPILASNGSFYFVTDGNPGGCEAGTGSCGVLAKISASGAAADEHNFCSSFDTQNDICLDGITPGGIMQASNGFIYGTTSVGGTNNHGVIYRTSVSGGYTVLYSFCAAAGCPDGLADYSPLVQSKDGNLYGTAANGGANGFGTFYRISLTGQFTSLYSFCSQASCADGGLPGDEGTDNGGYGFALGNDGNFYGTTETGGANDFGTFYKMTPAGVLTVLYNFCGQEGCADGQGGEQVILGSDGNFYGFTRAGGSGNVGTIYKMTPAGVITILHTFDVTDGEGVGARLMQASSGVFYGTTAVGGDPSCDCGTIFALKTGLKPFVETLPTSGKVGAKIGILGSGLKSATSVTFNGVSATFSVSSNNVIKATVPAGATTGPVQVVTPQGTLTSNIPFTIP